MRNIYVIFTVLESINIIIILFPEKRQKKGGLQLSWAGFSYIFVLCFLANHPTGLAGLARLAAKLILFLCVIEGQVQKVSGLY